MVTKHIAAAQKMGLNYLLYGQRIVAPRHYLHTLSVSESQISAILCEWPSAWQTATLSAVKYVATLIKKVRPSVRIRFSDELLGLAFFGRMITT